MKLTIGMIVKNEEKWLDNCLSAIKPILDNVDSELIITDTGSTDGTVGIAKKYTDKVYHFDWINDFAAARNFGLEKAQGEWFMMLDADDIFQSCDEVIGFFNSGEYKRYNSAAYISRNLFSTADLSEYSDLKAMRITKILPETRYVSVVHEYLNTFGAPVKDLKDIALHYGYAYDGNINILEKKQTRNSELLLKRLETEGDTNELLYVQLFECYSATFRNGEALRYLAIGKELCLKKNSIVLVVIYANEARLRFRNEEYAKAIEICNEYFSMSPQIRPGTLTTDAEMLYLRAMSYSKTGRTDNSFNDLCKLFDIYDDVITGRLITADSYIQPYEFATEQNYIPSFCLLIRYGIETCHSEQTEKYLKIFNIDYVNKKTLNTLYLTLASFFMLTGSGNALSAMNRLSAGEKRITDKNKIYSQYSKVTSDSIVEFIRKYGIDKNPDMIAVMMNKRFDFTELIDDNTDLKICAYMCCKHIIGFYDIAEKYDAGCIINNNKLGEAEKFIDYCISVKLMENENKSDDCKKTLMWKLVKLKNDINEKHKKENAEAEFLKLSEMIKQKIRSLISAGNLEEASVTFEKYRELAPNDPENTELSRLIQVNK